MIVDWYYEQDEAYPVITGLTPVRAYDEPCVTRTTHKTVLKYIKAREIYYALMRLIAMREVELE